MGRAALALAAHGIVPIFVADVASGRVSGFVAEARDRWRAVSRIEVTAVYDRFPSRVFPDRYRELMDGLGHLPMGNPRAFMELAQDKLESHGFLTGLGIRSPEVEADGARFAERLRDWGVGFLKPRYGTGGRGIVRVVAGASLPGRAPDSDPIIDGPLLLQRAIEPLAPWRGVCVRVAAQRLPDLSWFMCPAVARYSAHDWVVNAARGSQVALAAAFLPDPIMDEIRAGSEAVCAALAARPDGAWVVEVGMDWVVAQDGSVWLLELNSRPYGRLQALAEKRPEAFGQAHVQACARPLRFLADRAQGKSAAVEEERAEDQEERQPGDRG